jgi:hypothetical protein
MSEAGQQPTVSAGWLAHIGVVNWAVREDYAALSERPETQPERDDGLVEADVSVQQAWWLIGPGLTKIWQDERQQAWLLWRAMADYHFAGVDAVRFFDTDALHDEAAIEQVVEQVIESGVDWVFSMDAEHPLHQQLAEGLAVVVLPHFEALIAQPLLKRDAYLRLLQPEQFLSYGAEGADDF